MKYKINCFFQDKISLLSLFITSIIVFMAGPSGAKIADVNSYNYMAFAENQSAIVTIPKGAASPEVDITKLTPTQWYTPPRISVNQNDSITWINRDTEIHTVTSGNGAGLESLMTNKRGTKNGIFDSGIFKPGENWTHVFEKAGTFAYFYRVHPWMEGTVVVKKVASYPFQIIQLMHQDKGKKFSQFTLLLKITSTILIWLGPPSPTYRTASVFYYGFLRPSH